MKYKLIIFDFDGTLADTYPWFTQVLNEVADKYKFKKVAESEYEKLRGYDTNEILKYLGVPLWKMPMITNHMRKLMTKDIHQISLFEGIDNLLQCISNKGVILAVVSSNSYENVCQILGAENAALINYYECGVSIFGKQAKLKKILSKSGVLHKESIYIGDEIRDIEAAKNVNIAFGGVSWGYNKVKSLKRHSPSEIFNTVDEIIIKIA
jgi:phosphoglycolate phosphatase